MTLPSVSPGAPPSAHAASAHSAGPNAIRPSAGSVLARAPPIRLGRTRSAGAWPPAPSALEAHAFSAAPNTIAPSPRLVHAQGSTPADSPRKPPRCSDLPKTNRFGGWKPSDWRSCRVPVFGPAESRPGPGLSHLCGHLPVRAGRKRGGLGCRWARRAALSEGLNTAAASMGHEPIRVRLVREVRTTRCRKAGYWATTGAGRVTWTRAAFALFDPFEHRPGAQPG